MVASQLAFLLTARRCWVKFLVPGLFCVGSMRVKKVSSTSNCVLDTLCKLDQDLQEQPEVLLSSQALKITMTWMNLPMPSTCVLIISIGRKPHHIFTLIYLFLCHSLCSWSLSGCLG